MCTYVALPCTLDREIIVPSKDWTADVTRTFSNQNEIDQLHLEIELRPFTGPADRGEIPPRTIRLDTAAAAARLLRMIVFDPGKSDLCLRVLLASTAQTTFVNPLSDKKNKKKCQATLKVDFFH